MIEVPTIAFVIICLFTIPTIFLMIMGLCGFIASTIQFFKDIKNEQEWLRYGEEEESEESNAEEKGRR